MTSFADDPCAYCEEILQRFLDRELSEEERVEAEVHLEACSYCRKRYRFEVKLRKFVRQSVHEPVSPELLQKLSALRTSP